MANANNIGVPVKDPYFVFTPRPRQNENAQNENDKKKSCQYIICKRWCWVIILTIIGGGVGAALRNQRQSNVIKIPIITVMPPLVIPKPYPPYRPEISLKINRVIIAHTATENCFDKDSCEKQALAIHNVPFPNLSLNFLVGGDGSLHIGPRLLDTQGIHAKGNFSDSMCITFIGTFSKLYPTQRQLFASYIIIRESIRQNVTATNYRLYGARQFMETESPGNALYETIKKWPNWSDNIQK